MICTNCGQEVFSGPGRGFCTNCGTPLVLETDQPQQPLPQEPLPDEEATGPAEEGQTSITGQDRLESLETNLRMVLAQQLRLGERLSAIELRLGLPAGGQPARPRPQPVAPSPTATPPPSPRPGAPAGAKGASTTRLVASS